MGLFEVGLNAGYAMVGGRVAALKKCPCSRNPKYSKCMLAVSGGPWGGALLLASHITLIAYRIGKNCAGMKIIHIAE